MKSYPCLTEMGVRNPLQIASYSINSVDYVDVLRLTYERPKDSKLPGSKTFRFPRVQKELPAGKSKDSKAVVMESGSALKCVVEELEYLMKLKSENQDIAAVMLEELRLLQEDVALRSEYLKTLLAQINKV